MQTIEQYIDDLKEKTGSDYRTAKELGINKTTISSIRKRGLISDETAIKVADYLGIDRTELLIAAAIARSEGDVKNAWENASKRIGIAASITLASAISLGITSIETELTDSIQLPNMYIMLN